MSLWNLIKFIYSAIYPKNGTHDRPINIGLSLGCLAILIHCLGYRKTILPSDVATVTSYNRRLRDKKYEKIKVHQFLLDKVWPYKEHGVLSRQSVNFFFAIIYGLADGFLAYYFAQKNMRYKLMKSIGVGAGSALGTCMVTIEPRILFTSFIASVASDIAIQLHTDFDFDINHTELDTVLELKKFLTNFYKIVVPKLLNTTYDMCHINKSNKNYGFAIWVLLIFLASDLLIDYIEHAHRRKRKETSYSHKQIKSGFFNPIVATLKKPRFWIGSAASVSVACLGYFASKKLINDPATLATATNVKSLIQPT